MKRPLRVSFDIGGVLSKYPEVFKPMVETLQRGGAEVFVLTDMHDHEQSVRFVQGNGYNIPSDHILNSDYDTHGEDCKAVLIKEHGIDIHIDDFLAIVPTRSVCPSSCGRTPRSPTITTIS